MAAEEAKRTCVVVLHDDRVSREEVLCGAKVLPFGCVARLSAPGSGSLCILANKTASDPHEISLHSTLARRFGFENRTEAIIHVSNDASAVTATHVELFFRDQHLSRADMWRIKCAADGKAIYSGRSLDYLGSTAATVQAIYIKGDAVESALVSYQRTKLIFRSGSARYTFLIQISKEMLEYWHDGDLMYERMLSSYLPDLFRRWEVLKVRHQVSIILFGRSEEAGVAKDFFRVIAVDVSSALWRQLLRTLKSAFSNIKSQTQVSLAARGNMLEAIHIAAFDFVQANMDPYLSSTGTSVIAITAGTGLFETSFERLKRTTLMLMGNSTGVDVVALSPKPLHPVPLFRYSQVDTTEYALPHWVDISFWNGSLGTSKQGWLMPETTGYIEDIAITPLDSRPRGRQVPAPFMDQCDALAFGAPQLPNASQTIVAGAKQNILEASSEAMDAISRDAHDLDSDTKALSATSRLSTSERRASNASSITRAKRTSLQPHPLMQATRKISVGPRGLAPSRGVASTTVSVEHAQHGRDTATFSSNDASSGLARQIRQSLIRKGSQQSLVLHPALESDVVSRPINIGTGLEVEVDDSSDPASVMERKIMGTVPEEVLAFERQLSNTPKAKQSTFLDLARAAEVDDKPTNSPWVTLFNPCNPKRDNMRVASQYRKWQHVFPRAVSSSAFKWLSMCTPAALPLTNEYRPSLRELEQRATKKIRRIQVPPVDDVTRDAAGQVMSRLIASRLMHGFQMSLVESNAPGFGPLKHNERVLMSIGSLHHELHCISAAEIQIVEYDAHAIEQEDDKNCDLAGSRYSIRITSPLGNSSRVEVPFVATHTITDWSSIDDVTVNHSDDVEDTGRTRLRFVLVPVDPPRPALHHTQQIVRELSDEETRVDGIQKLTLLWQRHRHTSDKDHHHQAALVRSNAPAGALDRDPNPLAIEYQTRDPSAVVNAYGPLLTGQPYNAEQVAPLFAESEMFHSNTFDIAKLVRQMQEPPPHGVEFRDRRWFTRTHLRCFRGDEMVNWLLRVFKDLQSRDDAVAVGNELMTRGIFSHVRTKHAFRDGNYFYQIAGAHRTVDYPDTASVFAKNSLKSVPSTPLLESRPSPMIKPIVGDSDSVGKRTPKQTPTILALDRKQVLLSQMMQYNVDPTGKSEQLEVVSLHYDRIHNPENCYHIQLEWTNTTAKLVRDAVSRWTSLVDGHGLRLVQVPIVEASRLSTQHPFEVPVMVKLAAQPPEKIPPILQLDLQTFAPKVTEDSLAYQKAILRKMDFVLDYEAAASFTTKLDISYSFGRPDYELTQFVHKSGLVLAQISGNDRSDFLLLPNRLATPRSTVPGKAADTETPEGIVKRFKAFCRSSAALEAFYAEFGKVALTAPSPYTPGMSMADVDVPPMQLPPHLLHRVVMNGIL